MAGLSIRLILPSLTIDIPFDWDDPNGQKFGVIFVHRRKGRQFFLFTCQKRPSQAQLVASRKEIADLDKALSCLINWERNPMFPRESLALRCVGRLPESAGPAADGPHGDGQDASPGPGSILRSELSGGC